MAVILDTSTLAPGERAEALRAAMASASVPAAITPLNHGSSYDDRVRARLETWPLGDSAALLRRSSTGVRILRTPRQIRETPADRIALTLISPGAWRYDQSRAAHAAPAAGGP